MKTQSAAPSTILSPSIRSGRVPGNGTFGVVATILADVLAVELAIAAGSLIWSSVADAPAVAIPMPSLMAIALVAVYASQGLYTTIGIGYVEQLRRVTLGTCGFYMAGTAALFLLKTGDAHSRGAFLCSFLLALALVPLARAALIQFAGRRAWWGRPVAVLGSGSSAAAVIQTLHAQPALGLKPVFCLDDSDGTAATCSGIPVAGTLDPDSIRALRWIVGIQHAVLPGSGLPTDRMVRLLEDCSDVFPRVLLVPDLGAVCTASTTARDLDGALGLELRHNLLMPWNRFLKRALDLVIVACSSILAVPIILISAIWIRLISSGSPFYAHTREGEGGRSIRVFKLRTMHPDADMLLLQYLASSPDIRNEWERYFKLKDDPRILPGIGRLLRRTSLDELPQLWNVLKGDMSIVGPRPIVTNEIERYGEAFTLLKKLKPGITGLWQVSGRNDITYAERVRLDSYYVKNWSIWLDLVILFRTFGVLLFRRGAY